MTKTTTVAIIYADNNVKKSSFDTRTKHQVTARDDEYYEPYDYGKEKNPIGYWGAFSHLSKSIIGAGILAIPFGFKNVGYVIGIIGVILVGLLYAHIIHTLLLVEYELCKRLKIPNLTYIQVVEYSFDKGPQKIRSAGRYVTYSMYFNYVINGATYNAIFLLIIAGNLKHVYDHYFNADVPIIDIISGVIIVLILLNLIPRLKFLVPLSTLTSFFNVAIIAIVIFLPSNVSTQPAKPIGNVYYFPQFFSIIVTAVGATGMMIPLKNDLEKPKNFVMPFGILNITMLVITLLYSIFGCSAYFKYGDSIEGNILSNLPRGQVLSLTVYFLYSAAICISYTLTNYVVFDTIWSNCLGERLKEKRHKNLIVIVLKIFINLYTYVMATVMPNFEVFIAFSGTIGILTDIALPAILQIIILTTIASPDVEDQLKTRYVIFKNSLIIVLSLAMFAAAFVGCVIDLMEFYKNN